jgi:hypothetical protein
LISTQPVSDNNNVVLILSVYSQLPNPILMKFGQKLTVVPPVGWGEYGWDLTFDDSFFQLDKDNEPKWPSQGWWVWIPLKTGKSTISIKAKPLPCQNSNPPCDFPEYFVNLNIEVSP